MSDRARRGPKEIPGRTLGEPSAVVVVVAVAAAAAVLAVAVLGVAVALDLLSMMHWIHEKSKYFG